MESAMNLFRIGSMALAALLIGLVAGGATFAQEKKVVKVGDKAPAFQATDDTGKTWKSSDVVGKKVLVLYFYPADFTGGCTKQACGYRDDIEKLASKDIEVVGVSADSPKTHEMFKKDHKLSFTLLADEKGQLAKTFGVPAKIGETKTNGKDSAGKAVEVMRGGTIQRWTVVIDKSGNVAAIDDASKNAAGDAKRIESLVEKLPK
jgi:thioredoxin-dependent peroxiredoxin